MRYPNRAAIIAAALAGLSGIATAAPSTKAAPGDDMPCYGGPMWEGHHMDGKGMYGRHMDGRHMERRIDDLKTRLKLTPAQQPLFDRYVKSMEAQRDDMRSRFEQMRGKGDSLSLPERQQQHLDMMRARIKGMEETHTALTELYTKLTPEQRKVMDEMPRHRAGKREAPAAPKK